MAYQRPMLKKLYDRVTEPRRFIQIIMGPRQTGKTTMALALQDKLQVSADTLTEYHSADSATDYSAVWIDQIWESIRVRMVLEKKNTAVLILDELQKITEWSAAVKKHWDRDTRENRDIKPVLLGSSRLLLMDGLSESLMGRFEVIYASHWSLTEMQDAFGLSPEQYQWFGGYPGAASLINDELRFKEYIRSAIIEPTMTRDILLTTKIEKPALLKQLLDVGVGYSTQIMSYNRMLGQLQDAGNTTTLSKYIRLLDQAGLLTGLNKYSNRDIETKGTIPKFLVHNTALLSATRARVFEEALVDRKMWGTVVESSVGAHLLSQVNKLPNASLYYWRENDLEVDFVVAFKERIIGMEVKSGDESIPKKPAEKFAELFPKSSLLLIGRHGIPYETFMKAELADIFSM